LIHWIANHQSLIASVHVVPFYFAYLVFPANLKSSKQLYNMVSVGGLQRNWQRQQDRSNGIIRKGWKGKTNSYR
ncbi:hypothetical protein, partial [Sediminibacterium sp.]|uniref:hypothetical protein n=1 Tax=Sediminibacterium sp. TaxID=1917865 RepID=UPI0025FE8C6F